MMSDLLSVIKHLLYGHLGGVALTHCTAVRIVEGSNPGEKQDIELQFNQWKRLRLHINFLFAVLDKPFMFTYLYGKYFDRLPVLISQAQWIGGSRVPAGPALVQSTLHSFICDEGFVSCDDEMIESAMNYLTLCVDIQWHLMPSTTMSKHT